MNMFDILREAQGGKGIENLAQQFGLGPDQMNSVLKQVLPAMSAGFKQRTQTSDGLGNLLNKIQGTDYEDIYEDPNALKQAGTRDRGNQVLAEVFGSKEVSREVAQKAEFASGIGSTVIKAMLPMIASMVLGGMQRKTSGNSGMGGILGTLIQGMTGMGASQQRRGGGGLDDLLGAVLGGGMQQQRQQPRGGGGLGGILGSILGGGRQQQQRQAPQSGGLGGVLGGMFGGGARQQQAPVQRGQQGGLDDLLGGMFGQSPRQRSSTGDASLDSVIGMFDADEDGSVDMDILRQLARRR